MGQWHRESGFDLDNRAALRCGRMALCGTARWRGAQPRGLKRELS